MQSLKRTLNGRTLSRPLLIVSLSCSFFLQSALTLNAVTTIDGTSLEIVVSPEKTMVSNADLIKPDIYASNGVLHLVSSLLVPPGALQLTAEKYLLALNCTSFVSMLHSVNLTTFINDTDIEY